VTAPDAAAFLAAVTAGQPSHQAPNSRYRDTPTAQLTGPDGTVTVYLRRRFRPRPEALADIGTVTVQAGHRVDTLAADVFGDPTLFWRLADANLVDRPADLVAEPGRVLRIGAPDGIPGGAGA
jgi:hypothetical protein